MEVDFDKQIDTILRDLAKGKTLAESPPVSHLDADELSAFAENALPPKARLRTMEHLADCQNCRKILSTFVSLSDEAESETVHEVKTIAVISEIPWYRKLFAFPAISYAMGAMALLLVGTVGFLVLQNSQDTANSVAKNEPAAEKVKGPSGVSSDGEAPVSEIYSANATSNSAVSAANVASSSANSTIIPNSTVSSANTARVSEPKPTATPIATEETARGITLDAPTTESKSAKSERDKIAAKEDISSKGGESMQPEFEAAATPTPRADDNVVAGQQRTETVQNRATQNQTVYPDSGNEAKRSAPPAPPMAKKVPSRDDSVATGESKDEDRKNKTLSKPSAARSVAGKSFNSINGVWTDSGYRGGNTVNVKRGTDDYKKLDSGLRSTADYLGGTVIIVWKGKNYKIQ